jgi:hypothetical protein
VLLTFLFLEKAPEAHFGHGQLLVGFSAISQLSATFRRWQFFPVALFKRTAVGDKKNNPLRTISLPLRGVLILCPMHYVDMLISK